MKSRNEVLDHVRAKLRIRHFALSTEAAYCHWIGHYYDFCLARERTGTSEQRTEAFLTALAKRFVSAKTQNQALSALLFLYREVLGKPLGNVDAMRAKRPPVERVAPSIDQVRRFRAAVCDTEHTPARLLVDLLYGCGLRISESLDLRVKDVLWEENQLVVRHGKGGKDRRVPLPLACREPLRQQIEKSRLVWKDDRQTRPNIGVPLPWRLAAKYPKAPYAWEWFWVFPAAGFCRDPMNHQLVRFRLLQDSLQRVVHAASLKAGLGGMVTPHVLRHAYATHSREPIETLRHLMGHASIETTAGYRHAVVEGASNPLDSLVASTPSAGYESSTTGPVGDEPPRLPHWRPDIRWKGRSLQRPPSSPA